MSSSEMESCGINTFNIEHIHQNSTRLGYTAKELLDIKLPEPKWAIPGILPEGLSILGGKPKQGKSILAMNIALAVANGGKIFGDIYVEKKRVIYLALEDTLRRLQNRIRDMSPLYGEDVPDNLHLFTIWPKMKDEIGLERLDMEIYQHDGDVGLVVIDTLAKFRPSSTNSNIYARDYDDISLIKAFADKHGISILLIHHLRKSEADDIMDTFSGSFGLTGAADSLLVLDRAGGQLGAILHVTGRDVESSSKAMQLNAENLIWESIGNARYIQSTEQQQKLFDAIKDNATINNPLSPTDLEKRTELSNKYIRNTLPKFIEEGTVKKTDRGKYIFIGDIEDDENCEDIEDKGDN